MENNTNSITVSFAERNEFESILKNEQTDVKGDLKAQVASTGLFPTFGRVNLIYTTIILINQIIISFLIPIKLTFMEYNEPFIYVVYDLLVDVLFLSDIIIRFNTPIYLEGRLITDRKVIIKAYLRSWFILDLLACFPFSVFRWLSKDWQRGGNE